MNKSIPFGTDMPFEERLDAAKRLFEEYGRLLKEDGDISSLLVRYREAVKASWDAMRETGIIDECTACAVDDGGSCCGRGIEDHFDVTLLILNLLLGSALPDRPYDEKGCWFLGRMGCLIEARHVICVNYLCKRIYRNIPLDRIHCFQTRMSNETSLAFMLEERIKALIMRHGVQG
jgi:hypothetical protein